MREPAARHAVRRASRRRPVRGGRNPERIFKYIASALLGADALTGGAGIVALGVLLHMCIAMGWTVVFFLAASRIASLYRNAIPVGIAYGLAVWVAMNLVVLPLSRVKQGPFAASQVAVGAGVLVVCIGLPIAIGARAHFKRS